MSVLKADQRGSLQTRPSGSRAMNRTFRSTARRARRAPAGTLPCGNWRGTLQRSGGLLLACALTIGPMLLATGAENIGNVENGQRVFQACAACHSLKPGRHLTGPDAPGAAEGVNHDPRRGASVLPAQPRITGSWSTARGPCRHGLQGCIAGAGRYGDNV